MQPLISVIIPVYNVEKYLAQCLDSVIGQTYENLEIICVNDGSVDGSLGILREYERKDSRIKVIDKKNEGVSIARNTGLDAAKGEYVHFLDSDDYIESSLYEEALTCFTPDIDVVWFEHIQRHEDGSNWKHSWPLSGVHTVSDDLLLASDVNAPWDKLFKMSCLRKHGIRFPEYIIYEDMAFFWCLFMTSVDKIFFLNKPLHHYRINNSSIMVQTYRKKENSSICHIFLLDNIYDIWSKFNIFEDKIHLFTELCKRNFPLAVRFSPDWEVARCCWEMTTRLRKWNLPLQQGTFLQRLRDGEYNIDLVNELNPVLQKRKLNVFERIFCVRNEGNHKVIRLFGVKIASKRRKKR